MRQAIKVLHFGPADLFRLTMNGGSTPQKFQHDSQRIVQEFERRNFEATAFRENMFIRPIIGNEEFPMDDRDSRPNAVLVRWDKGTGKMIRSPLEIVDGFTPTTTEVCLDIT